MKKLSYTLILLGSIFLLLCTGCQQPGVNEYYTSHYSDLPSDYYHVINFEEGTSLKTITSTIRSLEENSTLQFNGRIDENFITTIAASIKESYKWFSLNFSNTTGIEEWKNWLSGLERLSSVYLPKTIKSVQKNAFTNCENLRTVSVPCPIQSYPEIHTSGYFSVTINFYGTLTEWLKSPAILPANTYLYLNGLKLSGTITIPDTITTIKKNAFNYSSFTKVIIPDSVTSIEEGAFFGCHELVEVSIPESISSINNETFYECSSLTSITIPESITSIGDRAFSCCSSLKTITIPDSVTSIGKSAFSNCSSLTSITLSGNITRIENNMFENCEGLTGITIPDSVSSIGDSAFSNCKKLANITIPNSIISIDKKAFENCYELAGITINSSVTSIDGNAFYGCGKLTSVNYNGTLEQWLEISFKNSTSSPCYADADLFINGTKLTDLVIPDSVTSIKNYAFYGCRSLKSVNIPGSVTSIGTGTFSSCSALTDIIIPDSITSLETDVFSRCTSLKSIAIPDSVTSIGENAFFGCTGLTSFTIPESVTSIGDNAFYRCTGLKNITIPAGVKNIGHSPFNGLSNINITISNFYDYKLYSGSSNVSVTITDGVNSIRENAFSGCNEITSITIPDSVTSIDWGAFYNCSNLKTVNFRGTQEQWQAISINKRNEPLTNATIIYNYK